MSAETQAMFDVFLSYSHNDSSIVESIGKKLKDENHIEVWLDKWILIPGNRWQQEMARGLEQARTCAVCIGRETPKGWFREEIQRALNRQVKDESFRVIPLILPGGDEEIVDEFLKLRTLVPFKEGVDDKYAMHLLVSGIQGRPPGRFPPVENILDLGLEELRTKLRKIKILHEEKLINEVLVIEYQRRVLDQEFSLKQGGQS